PVGLRLRDAGVLVVVADGVVALVGHARAVAGRAPADAVLAGVADGAEGTVVAGSRDRGVLADALGVAGVGGAGVAVVGAGAAGHRQLAGGRAAVAVARVAVV